jgi:hypothetical protein
MKNGIVKWFLRITGVLLLFLLFIFILIQVGLSRIAREVENNPQNLKMNEDQVSKLLDDAVSGIPMLEQNITSQEASSYKIKKTFNLIPYKSSTFEATYVPAHSTFYYNHQLTWGDVKTIMATLDKKGIKTGTYNLSNIQAGYIEKDLAGLTAGNETNITFDGGCAKYVLMIANKGRQDLFSGYRASFSATEATKIDGVCTDILY